MTGVLAILRFAAKHGRACLVLGLLAGFLLPSVAAVLRVWLPELVALLLFLAAFRIGPKAAFGSISDARSTLFLVLFFQAVLPVAAVLAFGLAGLMATPVALALVLMLSAPSVTGSPNFTLLMGHDPSGAMRLLLAGTALFPLTMLPVFLLVPSLGSAADVALASVRLLGVIAVSVVLAFGLRSRVATLAAPHREALDGASAIVLAVVVVGLMTALGPTLRTDPWLVAGWMAVAFGANFGLQLISWLWFKSRGVTRNAVGISIIAGNRNIALFLVALPPSITDQLLLFLGCYQVPMYLTPLVLQGFYGRGSA